jgi:DNA-binding transcriptional ArsR family regulator
MSAAEAAAPVFAALADRTRLSLLMSISRGGSRSIASLSAQTRLTRQAVAKHLRVLENAGLVRSARAGRERGYSLCEERLAAPRAYLDAVSAGWDEALARLREQVEA